MEVRPGKSYGAAGLVWGDGRADSAGREVGSGDSRGSSAVGEEAGRRGEAGTLRMGCI